MTGMFAIGFAALSLVPGVSAVGLFAFSFVTDIYLEGVSMYYERN